MPLPSGTPFHGQFIGDASSVQTFTLYNAGGVSALTVNATDTVVIDSIELALSGVAAVITLIDDHNGSGTLGAGELIAQFGLQGSAGGQIFIAFPTINHVCKVGTTPKVLCGTGGITVYCTIRGNIIRG